MARRPRLTQTAIRRRLAEVERRYGSQLSAEFLRAVAGLGRRVVLNDIIEAIEGGDLEKAVRVLGIDSPVFQGVQEPVRGAFQNGGAVVAESLPVVRGPDGVRTSFIFDQRDVVAEQWLRDRSSSLVTRITDSVRDGVRVRLQEGQIRGDNPRTVALDIIGRIDPVSGRRVGGILGLNGPQTQFVNNARNELASGVAPDLRNYLNRTARDKRFDHWVHKALAGEPIPADIQQKMIGRYSDTLLKLRGDTIGRTEMIEALNNSQFQAYEQAKAKGIIKTTTKKWNSAGDNRVRDTHAHMDTEPPIPLDQPFILPDGSAVMFPGDASLGAAPEEIINCRCVVTYHVDFFEGVE